jgi:hypothetical protein
MKTFYIIKSFLPIICLPIAPGVLQVELQRQGLLGGNTSVLIAVLLQLLFTVVIVLWIARAIRHEHEEKAYLKMSCVSKKVFHEGEWMTVERYLADRHNIVVSHGMTPEESTEWLRDAREWVRTQAASEVNVPQPYRRTWSAERDLAGVSATAHVG